MLARLKSVVGSFVRWIVAVDGARVAGNFVESDVGAGVAFTLGVGVRRSAAHDDDTSASNASEMLSRFIFDIHNPSEARKSLASNISKFLRFPLFIVP